MKFKANSIKTENISLNKIKNKKGNFINSKIENSAEKFDSSEDTNGFFDNITDGLKNIATATGDLAVKGLATNAVLTTSFFSGVLDICESVGDTVVLAGGTVASGVTSIFDKDLSNKIKEGTMDTISKELVTDLNEFIYEDTAIGRTINDKAIFKYDSKLTSGVRKVTETGVEIAGAVALTVATAGIGTAGVAATGVASSAVTSALIVGGAGTAVGTGASAEKLFKDEANRSFGKDSGLALLNGVGKGIESISVGKMGAGLLTLGGVIKNFGVKKVAGSAIGKTSSVVKNFNVKTIVSKEFIKKSVKNTVKDVDFYIDTLGVGANNLTEAYTVWSKTGEFDLDVKKLAAELALAGSINLVLGGAQTIIELDGKPLSIDDILVKYDDLMLKMEDPDFKAYMELRQSGNPYTPNAEYEKLIKEFDSVTSQLDDYCNEQLELSKKLQSNGIALKNEILATNKKGMSELEKARNLYIELNKRVNYNTYGLLSNDYRYSLKSDEIYNTIQSFENLESNQVICKGWSELYRELLIESGFSSNQVKIMGGTDKISHVWVEVELTNGKILVCDATQNSGAYMDLSICKTGETPQMFIYTDKSNSGRKASDLRMDSKVRTKSLAKMAKVDKKIGYTKSEEFDSLCSKLKNKFKPSEKALVAVTTDTFDVDLPKEMDGLEAYQYFSRLGKTDASFNLLMINTIPEMVANALDPKTGRVMLYSKSFGKMMFDDMNRATEFISKFEEIKLR